MEKQQKQQQVLRDDNKREKVFGVTTKKANGLQDDNKMPR